MKVAVVTGTRAEYGIWRPVLRALRGTRGMEVQLVVTGMHLLAEFGATAREIAGDGRREGWSIAARVVMYGKRASAAASLARGIEGMGQALHRLSPDIVCVLGDRLEILAAAAAAMTQGRAIAHVHGGETAPGQWDEQIRHAVTKMAQLHFCATAAARRRIIQMGEDRRNVHLVGAPALDEVRRFLGAVDDGDAAGNSRRTHIVHGRRGAYPPGRGTRDLSNGRALVVLHPTSADEGVEEQRTRMLIESLRRSGRSDLLAVGPNNDPGHRGILRAYRSGGVRVVMSLGQHGFWRELRERRLLAGNSSSGIIEAASLRCAVVNIGDRQAGRERNGNVLDVPWDAGAMREAFGAALSDRRFVRCVASGRNIYGDGLASGRIARILRSADVAALRTPKRFVDLNRTVDEAT